MAAIIKSATIFGLECQPVDVEADLARQFGKFIIVGLPDQSVAEAKERVKLAIKNSNLHFPSKTVVINLAPADLKKVGSHYDLAMAVSILNLSDQIVLQEDDKKACYLGELSLNGDIKAVNGVLSVVIKMKELGVKKIYLPAANAKEAGLIVGMKIYPVKNVYQLYQHLTGNKLIKKQLPTKTSLKGGITSIVDMSDINGQVQAKRALLIAAAGGHNILLSGPPGSGKTMLAKALVSILPPLTLEQSMEVTNIYSVANLLAKDHPLITIPPWRHPHHTASGISLIGGGSYPTPGEITLAHNGLLFLDELPEFPRAVLENLRQPLEDKTVTVSRVSGTFNFPANFILVAAMNPCPCGWLSDIEKNCVCTPGQIIKYKNKISGPLLDRIDLHVEVPRLKYDELKNDNKINQTSEEIRLATIKVRQLQYKRNNNLLNSALQGKQLKKYCQTNSDSDLLLRQAVNQLNLSPRSYYRILRVARTIADLSDSESILVEHIAEALQYRIRS